MLERRLPGLRGLGNSSHALRKGPGQAAMWSRAREEGAVGDQRMPCVGGRGLGRCPQTRSGGQSYDRPRTCHFTIYTVCLIQGAYACPLGQPPTGARKTGLAP